MNPEQNPFADDPDRRELWEMLVARDIDAFLAADWGRIDDDFKRDGFIGLHARHSPDTDRWRLAFGTVEAYRDEWLRQAHETRKIAYAEPLRAAIFRATSLTDIDINGSVAVLHKKFNGAIRRADGGADRLLWQTLYFCARDAGCWRIAGFVGYMPYTLTSPAD
ncbi:hypothetical protein [Dongia deserti]|uniref:hypothetical protein n=1 Tax=Dongia deserti TaxID=2268030 RepID=UPI0025497A16|nr:hypothetical protein [Dongia deserti]